jgi:predicted small lipoprotein YifL
MRASSFLLLVLLLSAAGCGGNGDAETPAAEEMTATEETSATEHETGEPLEIELSAVNDSGVSGTATLSESEGDGPPKFTVELTAEPAGDASRPAHIHNVTCAEYAKIKDYDAQAKTVSDTLSNVDQGKSTSTVPGKLTERTTGEYSINVHASAIPFPAIACGDIPAHE